MQDILKIYWEMCYIIGIYKIMYSKLKKISKGINFMLFPIIKAPEFTKTINKSRSFSFYVLRKVLIKNASS